MPKPFNVDIKVIVEVTTRLEIGDDNKGSDSIGQHVDRLIDHYQRNGSVPKKLAVDLSQLPPVNADYLD